MRKLIAAVFCAAFCAIALAQQSLNNDSVTRMVKAGLSDDVVIATINSSPGQYTTTPDALIALKQAGVSDKVIGAMITKERSDATAVPPSSGVNSGGEVAASPASATETSGKNLAIDSRPVPGSRVVIAPMGGFETYFAAAVREKGVPITLTLDKASAQFFVVSTNTEWQGFVYGSGGSASWGPNGGSAAHGAAASSTRGLEASIMLIDAKSKDIVWAYEVHKSSHGSLLLGTFGARGQQSIAEACAKHLKEFIENGK